MFVNELRYHKLRLPEEGQHVYLAVDDAVRQMRESFEIDADQPFAIGEETQRVLTGVYNDNPSFFYYTPTCYQTYSYEDKLVYEINYLYTKEQAKELEQMLAEFLREFYREHVSSKMKDHEKVLLIHNYLVSTVTYEDAVKTDKNVDLDVYNILGALLKKRAVCWGIAMAFKLLCDYLEVPSLVIIGKSEHESDEDNNHAWNIVRVDNEFYHVDVTWNLRIKGAEQYVYDYYNLDDQMMSAVHEWDRDYYPNCNGFEYNYFYQNRCYVSDIEQIRPFYLEKLKKLGQEELITILKYRGLMPKDELIKQEIRNAVSDCLREENNQNISWKTVINRKLQNVYVVFEGGDLNVAD